MTKALESLPISETIEPTSAADIPATLRDCHDSDSAVYPIGGATSLDFGLPAKKRGIGLSLAKLNRVVDYPARDMTITVESGVTIQTLGEVLSRERQRLPIDAPQAQQSTLGGVVATNFN